MVLARLGWLGATVLGPPARKGCTMRTSRLCYVVATLLVVAEYGLADSIDFQSGHLELHARDIDSDNRPY